MGKNEERHLARLFELAEATDNDEARIYCCREMGRREYFIAKLRGYYELTDIERDWLLEFLENLQQ